MKILFTGFEPFGGESFNSSWKAVRRLPDTLDEAQLLKLQLPVTFAGCGPVLERVVRAERPDAVLCVGQAGGRAAVTVERVALNLADARIPDNAGAQPVDVPVVPDGPAAYFATIPVKAAVRRVRAAGIPCDLSYTAGTYVCNALLYQALHLVAGPDPVQPAPLAGFIHLPYAEEQLAGKPDGTPALSLGAMTHALECAALAVLEELRLGTSSRAALGSLPWLRGAGERQPDTDGSMGTLC